MVYETGGAIGADYREFPSYGGTVLNVGPNCSGGGCNGCASSSGCGGCGGGCGVGSRRAFADLDLLRRKILQK